MDILMPQLGETVAEGKVTAWFKAVGDAVNPGENLFEIETDKVSMEVPATAAGSLAEIRVAVGMVAPVGAVVAVLSATSGGIGTAPSQAGAPAPPPQRPSAPPIAALPRTAVAAAPMTSLDVDARAARPTLLDPFREVRTPERNYGPARLPNGTAVTPLARRLAGEAGIDLRRVAASGPHGRIVARDVTAAVAARAGRVVPPAVQKGLAAPTAEQIKALFEPGSYVELPLDDMRRAVAARLTDARLTIPHFYLAADVEVDRLVALRREANAAALPDAAGNPAFKLSLNDFIIKAWALALIRVPAANAVWAEDRVLRFRRADIGVAVEGGLLTPVIPSADSKSMRAISAEMQDLAARAQTGNLKPEELAGGTSAISNLGMHGIREFSAIINPPHATILAIGAAARQPVEAADGGVRFVSRMTVTLSCDHRIVDGAAGAALLTAFRQGIENPIGLFM